MALAAGMYKAPVASAVLLTFHSCFVFQSFPYLLRGGLMKNLFLVCSALVPVLLATASVWADTFVYVSDSRDNAIKIFRLQDTDGTLQEVDVLKLMGTPGSLGVDPQRRFLFASVRSTNSLASFAVDPSTGKLRPISSTQLAEGANAAYVATDRRGKYLIAASYSGGRVTVHAIAQDGKLSEQPIQTVETTRTAHAAVFDPDNRLVFVPHVDPNAVYQFRFHEETGQLTELGKAPGGSENAGPRHLAIHPSGKFAFTSDEQGSSVTLYSLGSQDGSTQNLRPIQTLSTLPADYTQRNSTADVKVHPSGRFVWVSNRGHDSLAGFAFDESTAKLKSLGQTPTEKTPRSFDVDPSGRYLYSAGEGSGNLAAYRIDSATGQLTRFQTYEIGKSLSWVAVVKM
jgi:6-phosphogluconolactonase